MWWRAIWVKFNPTRKNRPQGCKLERKLTHATRPLCGESFLLAVQAVRLQRFVLGGALCDDAVDGVEDSVNG